MTEDVNSMFVFNYGRAMNRGLRRKMMCRQMGGLKYNLQLNSIH